MRKAPNLKAEKFRDHQASMGVTGENSGAFVVPCGLVFLRVIVSNGGGWDHVSASLPDRCPRWEEMCVVKGLFFKDDEFAMQLHVARSEHINVHPYCLHLWRPQEEQERQSILTQYMRDREMMSEAMRAAYDALEMAPTPGPIPLPPSVMVGPKTWSVDNDRGDA